MDPITLGLLIGAGAGIAKSELVDRPRERRQRKLAAETQRYSPWTGLRANSIQEADPLGNALQFGTQGAAFGQNLQSAQTENELMKEQRDWFKRSRGYNNSWGAARGTGLDPNMEIAGPVDYDRVLGRKLYGSF